jgi:hypothetical protein
MKENLFLGCFFHIESWRCDFFALDHKIKRRDFIGVGSGSDKLTFLNEFFVVLILKLEGL